MFSFSRHAGLNRPFGIIGHENLLFLYSIMGMIEFVFWETKEYTNIIYYFIRNILL